MLLFETQLVELETCEISYAYLKSSSCGNFLKLNWGKRSQSRVNFSNDHGQLHNYTLTWGGGGGGGGNGIKWRLFLWRTWKNPSYE